MGAFEGSTFLFYLNASNVSRKCVKEMCQGKVFLASLCGAVQLIKV